ncbi:MAG: aminoacyl-tRNA hydrolase [Pseudomonadota bacterium]
MKLIAGLGNPGRSYSRHRHNAGFRVIDELALRHGMDVCKHSFGALTASGAIAGESVLLAKPQTYMNLSGEPVTSLLRYYKLDADSLIVVHDDLDIDSGKIKLAKCAGSAGHNGVASIIETLGHKDFIRIRVGVGRPPEGMDGADYVLSPISKDEERIMAKAFEQAASAIEMIISKGLAKAQQEYH